ncbi:MAG: hypothetical protein OXF56_03160, partial [Rhodobacteraceae bacterium]|nr:hypothetical protein [Paracoccaceae bacterium]
VVFFDNYTIPCGGSDFQDHPSKIVEIGGKFTRLKDFARGSASKVQVFGCHRILLIHIDWRQIVFCLGGP